MSDVYKFSPETALSGSFNLPPTSLFQILRNIVVLGI